MTTAHKGVDFCRILQKSKNAVTVTVTEVT